MPIVASRALLIGLLFLAPVAFGSNAPAFWAINGGLAAAALVAAVLALPQTDDASLDWRFLAFVLVCAFGLVVWMELQGLGSIEGLQHPIWAMLPPRRGAGTISLAPEATATAATNFAILTSAGLASAIVATKKNGARAILIALLTSASAIAGYGLILALLHSSTILWLRKWAYEGYLTGTFVNRNNAATFFGFGLTVAGALLLSGRNAASEARGGDRTSSIRTMALLAAGTILLVALLRTGSRAGLASSVLGVVVVIASWYAQNRRRTFVAIGAVIAGAVVLSAAAGRPLFARIAQLGLSLGDRDYVYRDTLAAIADRPFFGHGAGGFAYLFPIYRGTELPPDLSWVHAHNTYLEVAADIGLPFLAVGLAMVSYAIWVMVRVIARLESARPSTIAATGACALAGAHSLLDFSLEIQGVALPFAILFGTGVGEALATNAQRSAAAASYAARSATAKRVSLVFSGMLLSFLIFGVARLAVIALGLPQYLWLGGTQALLSDEAGFQPAAARRAELASRYVNSTAFFPARYGDCARWPDSIRTAYQCKAMLDETLAFAPAAGELWIEKGRLSLLSGDHSGALAAFASAHAVAPNEGWLALQRARLLLSAGLSLPDGLRHDLEQDVGVVLRSAALSKILAHDFASDAIVRAELARQLEQSSNPDDALRFLEIVRQER